MNQTELELQEFLEQKYNTKLNPTTKGFSVVCLLGVIYEQSPSDMENRLNFMMDMAQKGWSDRKALLKVTEEALMAQPENIRYILETKIDFARDVKREPVVELYEKGEFKGLHYAVFNDFFNEACV